MRNYITNICLVVGSLFWSTLVTSVNQFSSHANLPQVQTLHIEAGPVIHRIYRQDQPCPACMGCIRYALHTQAFAHYIVLSSFSHFLSPHTALTLDTSVLSSRLLSSPLTSHLISYHPISSHPIPSHLLPSLLIIYSISSSIYQSS